MMAVAVALSAGILTGDWVANRVPVWVWGATLVTLLVLLSTLKVNRYLHTFGVLLGTMVFGIWLTIEREQASRVVLPDHEVAYEAAIISEPQVRGKVWKCDILITNLGQTIKAKASILRDSSHHPPAMGDGIVATSVLEYPANYWQNARFDYAKWLTIHGFKAQTFIYKNNWEHADVSLKQLSLWQRTKFAALKFRHRLIEKFRHAGLESNQLALLSAMSLGDKSLLSPAVKQDFAVSGGAHVLALSGLHLGILYAILLFFVDFLVRLWPNRSGRSHHVLRSSIVQTVTLTAIWCYVLVTGMPSSVLRAATMLTVYGFFSVLNRDKASLNTLAVAAVIMLIVNPMTLWDAGFQMSFMAVLGILLLLPRRRMNWLLSLVLVSFAAQVAVAPLVMHYFGRFPTYFLLTNFIVIPCATLLLYGTILLFFVSPIAPLQAAIGYGLNAISGWMSSGVAWIASLPGASIEDISLNAVQTAAFYAFLFCLYRIISLTLHPKW